MFQPKYVGVILALALFSTCKQKEAQTKDSRAHPGDFYTITKEYENSKIDGYNMYIPKSCTPESSPFPIIVFLQGGLGVGGKVDAIFNWELPKELKETYDLDSELSQLKLNTFVYVMPHISQGQFYDYVDAINEILEEVLENYNVDKQRIYLTGLSRGGHGAWGVASKLPQRFAAIAPICGAAHGISDYNALAGLPIWAAHNPLDERVSYYRTSNIVEKIEQLSGEDFHRIKKVSEAAYQTNNRIFTSGENPGNSHDAWTEMYNEVNFYKWLLRFKKE